MGVWKTAGRALAGTSALAFALLAARKAQHDHRVNSIWWTLEQAGTASGLFEEEMVAALPDPARRYFLHAIKPGTPLASTLHWHYSGSIKPNKAMPWMPLAAEQIIVKDRGFVWKAKVGAGPLLITGADYYLDGEARMKIAMYDLVPVVNATGPDLARSALGRLLVEGVALPSALLPSSNVAIEGIDESRFRAVVQLHGETTPITVTVDEKGRVKEQVMPRWGNLTEDGSFQYIPYGIVAQEERTFDGYTIPSRLRLGWWYGTDRYLEVIRLVVDRARFD